MNALEDKKAEDIILLDVSAQSSFADYFIICTGTSERQLRALADALDEAARHLRPRLHPKIEGHAEHGWVLVDFNAVIVHLFSAEKRHHYRLEELWHEGKKVLHIK